MDFSDGSTATTEYSWDKNGNITRDLNRKISKIQYNSLNLPETNTSSEQDKAAREAAGKEIDKAYSLIGANCATMVQEALSAAGKNPGYISILSVVAYLSLPQSFSQIALQSNLAPNVIFQNIKFYNSGKTINP